MRSVMFATELAEGYDVPRAARAYVAVESAPPMATDTVSFTPDQDERLHAADREVQAAYEQVEQWLRQRAAASAAPASSMTTEERAGYAEARERLSCLSRERDALRARLIEERAVALRRQQLASMVADQEFGRSSLRSAANAPHERGSLIGRLFGRK